MIQTATAFPEIEDRDPSVGLNTGHDHETVFIMQRLALDITVKALIVNTGITVTRVEDLFTEGDIEEDGVPKDVDWFLSEDAEFGLQVDLGIPSDLLSKVRDKVRALRVLYEERAAA